MGEQDEINNAQIRSDENKFVAELAAESIHSTDLSGSDDDEHEGDDENDEHSHESSDGIINKIIQFFSPLFFKN